MSSGQVINFLGASRAESFPLQGIGQQSENRVNLLAIGDSRTAQNHFGSWPFVYRFNNGPIDVALGFVRDMYRWQKEFNLGINGDTSQGIDTRKAVDIPAVLARRPATDEWDAVYWCGGNDFLAAVSQAGFSGYFKSTMKYMMRLGFRNIFVMSEIPYPSGYGGESAGTHATRIALAKQYNDVMRDFCAQNETLHYVDNYGLYGSAADPDVSDPTYNGGDIHPGSIGSLILGRSLANTMIKARGLPALTPGKAISANPSLIDLETIGQSGSVNNFYCSTKSAGVLLARTVGEDALIVTLDSTDGTQRSFNIFNNTTTVSDALMPGDIVQACIEYEILDASGQPYPPVAYVQEEGGSNFAWANSNPAGYTKGVILGLGRQVHMSDPFLVPTGKANKVMQPFMNSTATANTLLKFKVYELSCRRVYTSPNAEYSAAITLPIHRTNIKCLTNTASAGFTITLPALTAVDDGKIYNFMDTEGNASVKNITLAGTGTNNIKVGGAAAANTLVLNVDFFNRSFRADRGANCWVDVTQGSVKYYKETSVATDVASTSTTLADITGLTANVESGKSYSFVAKLFFDADATGGHKYSLSGTATVSALKAQINAVSNTSNLFVLNSRVTALNSAAGQAGATAGYVEITGTLTASANGTFKPQFAQNAAGGTSSVLAGSSFVVREI